MRVLLIHQAFASLQDPGGTRHFELARVMVQAGHGFTIVAGDTNYTTGEKVIPGNKNVLGTEFDGIRILRTYSLPGLHKSFFWRVITFLSFMLTSVWVGLRAGPADLIMGTSPPLFQAVSAWLVALLRRRPLLIEIRDLWPDFAIDMGVLRNPFLIRLSRCLELFIYRRATHILVNSPAYRQHILGKGIPSRKISLIANGVDSVMFRADDQRSSVRQSLGLKDAFIVTYAGALGLANDIPTILRAAKQLQDLPDVNILLIGDGKERANLQLFARQLGLENVQFLGARPKTEIPSLLAASDVCVAILQNIPMFRTTYPNKVFDYMAAGRPTILAIDGVIRQVIEASKGGLFVPPGDDRALAQAVRFLHRNPEQAKSIGCSARDYVARHFDRQTQARAFLDLTLSLANK